MLSIRQITIVVLLLACMPAGSAWGQTNPVATEFSANQIMENDNLSEPVKEKPFIGRFNIEYGFSSYTAKTPTGTPQNLEDFYDDLKKGNNFAIDAAFFFHREYAVGFKYSKFSSSASITGLALTDPETGDVLVSGNATEDISITFAGPMFMAISTFAGNRVVLFSSLSIGSLSYTDKATAFGENVKLSNTTVGLSGNLGLDYLLTTNIAIGLSFTFVNGTFTELKLNDSSTYEPEKDVTANHYNFVAGIKLYLGN